VGFELILFPCLSSLHACLLHGLGSLYNFFDFRNSPIHLLQSIVNFAHPIFVLVILLEKSASYTWKKYDTFYWVNNIPLRAWLFYENQSTNFSV